MSTEEPVRRRIRPAQALAVVVSIATLLLQLLPVVVHRLSFSLAIGLAALELAALLGSAVAVRDDLRMRAIVVLLACSALWTLLTYAVLSDRPQTGDLVSVLSSLLGAPILLTLLSPVPVKR